ncbi:MAG: tetratricopeptide repeat protein [Pseudomonadota bacterium]
MDSNYELAIKIADAEQNEGQSSKVLNLLDLGVEGGDERAIYARAVCYSNGTFGSDIDESKAFRLFSKLSESNIPEALFDLGACYDLGQGVAKDQFAAFECYLRAATLGHKEACCQVSEFFREGVVVPESEYLRRFWLGRSQKKEAEISPADRIQLR